jgi:chitin synthase
VPVLGRALLDAHVLDPELRTHARRPHEAPRHPAGVTREARDQHAHLAHVRVRGAVFVIPTLGPIICPTEHVPDTNELAGHTTKNMPNQVYMSIRGEVFDLTELAQSHLRVARVVPQKSLLTYGGKAAHDIFPVQVSTLCNGANDSVSPCVNLDVSNRMDENAQYHDCWFFTNDSRPDWYFGVMIAVRWNYRVGFVSYQPKAIRQMTSAGSAVAIYDQLVYDLTSYTGIRPDIQVPAAQYVDLERLPDVR